MINQKRLVDCFLKLVAIKSFSGDEGEITRVLSSEIEALTIVWNIDDAGNLIARMPCNTEGFEPIILCCHMDTVKPGDSTAVIMRDGIISSDGTGILGADDKAGIAAVMEMLHIIDEYRIPHGDIEIIFTVMEESGMLGAKRLDFSKINSRTAYVIDGSMKPGFITTAAPYKNKIEVSIKGTAAHAGVNPEKGVSSIMVAARAISDMRLMRIDEQTTANIGTISGGSTENVVCSEVSLRAEVRSHDQEKLLLQTEHMQTCFESSALLYGAKVDFNVTLLYPGYRIAAEEYAVRCFKSACANAGLEFSTGTSGGGSDANIFNKSGIKAVVVGTGARNPHSVSESISITDLSATAGLLVELVKASKPV